MSSSVNGPRNYNYYRLAAPADMGKDIGPRNYNYYRPPAPKTKKRRKENRKRKETIN